MCVISLFAESVPSISISTEEIRIFVLNSCVTVQLNCSIDYDPTVTLVWVQGEFEPKPIPDEYTIKTIYQDSIVLTLDFSSNCAYLNITFEGIALYCLANNTLGTVRSRSVMLLQPGEGW